MVINELINQIETAFNTHWIGKKFEDMDDAHKGFSEIASEILPENLSVEFWRIEDKNTGLTLFNYDFDIIEDKRYKVNRAGRMNSVKIKPAIKLKNSETLEDLIFKSNKKEAEDSVRRTLNIIDKLKEDMVKCENELIERREHLATFQ